MKNHLYTSIILLWLTFLQCCRSVESQDLIITDATANAVPSTESTYDHMIPLEDNLAFHWNDVRGDRFMGRLIHKADSIEQAPSWLGFGVYHSNHNYTTLPTQNMMVGSTAMIGMITTAEASTPAQHYHLSAQTVEGISIASDDTSYSNAVVIQHDSEDGSVITDLSFTKALEGSGTSQGNLRRDGANVFLWAVGPPGATGGVLGKHSLKGVLYLDLMAVQQKVEGATTTAAGGGAGGEGGADPALNTVVNTAPIIRGQCGSSLLDGSDAGQVALTPTLTFHWQLVGRGTKVQIALEYSGREAWLGVATSANGQMLGSSAVIGSPGADDLSIPPTHYNLNDQNLNGVVEDASVILEDASIQSAISPSDPSKITTILQYTKTLDDPNDAVPITTGLTTFLYAVGASRELAYHEHRGSFQLNLEDCGGTITGVAGVWTRHGTFAAHGFFAVLAWGLASPFAATMAWFRTLVPASWIYIHVFANVFSFLGTLLSFIIVVIGVTKEDAADHFQKAHHWVGLLLFGLSTFQVINGFLRPPVQRKDPNRPDLPQDTFLGIIPIPRTPRETWTLMHRVSGLVAIAMGIYQIQSGLGLYAQRFQTNSMVSYYWMYVGLFFVSLIGLKVWVYYEEDKARQGVMQAVSTTESNHFQEDEDNADGNNEEIPPHQPTTPNTSRKMSRRMDAEGMPTEAPVVLNGTLS